MRLTKGKTYQDWLDGKFKPSGIRDTTLHCSVEERKKIMQHSKKVLLEKSPELFEKYKSAFERDASRITRTKSETINIQLQLIRRLITIDYEKVHGHNLLGKYVQVFANGQEWTYRTLEKVSAWMKLFDQGLLDYVVLESPEIVFKGASDLAMAPFRAYSLLELYKYLSEPPNANMFDEVIPDGIKRLEFHEELVWFLKAKLYDPNDHFKTLEEFYQKVEEMTGKNAQGFGNHWRKATNAVLDINAIKKREYLKSILTLLQKEEIHKLNALITRNDLKKVIKKHLA